MKEIETNIGSDGFEEVPSSKQTQTFAPSYSASGQQNAQPTQGANRPDFRIVQVDTDKNGQVNYKNVGGMWKNISKNGNEFYTLMIGPLKLLVFPNTNK